MSSVLFRSRIAAIGWLFIASVGSAQLSSEEAAPTASVEYEGHADCPDFEAFQDLVTARLGYMPFRAEAPRTLHIRVTLAEGRYNGTLMNSAELSEDRPRRVDAGRCDEVVEALAMLVALDIDPLGEGAARSAEPTRQPLPPELEQLDQETVPVETVPESVIVERALAERSWGPFLFGELKLFTSFASLPGLSVGGGVGVGLRWSGFELLAELSLEATPGTTLVEEAPVRSNLWRAGVAPCLNAGIFRGCALMQFGQLRTRTELAVLPNSGTAWVAYAGARVGLEFEGGDFAFSLSANCVVPVVRAELSFGDDVAWTAPLFAGGIAASLRFGRSRDGIAPEHTSVAGE